MQDPKNSEVQGEKVYAALPEPQGDNGYGDDLWDEESMRAFADATAALRATPAQDGHAAFKAYLQECDDCAIVADVAGAFHAAWKKRAAPAQAVAVPPLTPDEARRAAQVARLMNGPSDTTQPSEYAMAGALALSAKLAAAPSIEDLCARIKAADDAAADNDYMLDSNDCIKVLRGQWKGPLAMDKPAAPAQEHATQLAGQAVSMSHREWRFALQEAIDAEIDSRGDESNVRRMKRAKAVLSTMLAAAPAPAQEAAPAWGDIYHSMDDIRALLARQHKMSHSDFITELAGIVTATPRQEAAPALEAPAAMAVPEGYMLTPLNPSGAMRKAGREEMEKYGADAHAPGIYKAMLAAAHQAPAAPAGLDETMQALSDLTNALRERHHGRMPEEVQRAYDKAWTIVFAGPRATPAPAAPAVDALIERDAEYYRFIKRHGLILSGGNQKFGWPTAPFGSECDLYIADELEEERAAIAAQANGGEHEL